MNEQKLTEIAKRSGLMDLCDCFDKPSENELLFDTRVWTLDSYTPFDTLLFNKKGYTSFYNFVDKLQIENELFECHFLYDISSYEYWSLDMEESNYLFLTIQFKRELTESELESVFDEIVNEIIYPLQNKWESLIDNKNYIRKVKEN